ncbi:MAG: SIMPL domain-containing protein [Sphingomicrobium sp.]
MRMISLLACSLLMPIAPSAAIAQSLPTPTIAEMAATPLVRVNIAETLRTRPDEASLTVGTQAKAATAKGAVAANKAKTEKLLAAIRAAGVREKDIQTQGLQLQPDYRYDRQPDGQGQQRLVGYIASNSVLIKTRDVDALTSLLDSLTAAGADTVYGPNFSISNPAPLRAEARVRAMTRGEAEAVEYARNNGFARVRLLSVEEGTSYRGTDVVVTGGRMAQHNAAPPPPPPMPERDGGGVVAPGQIETGVTLNLLYRMEK